MPTTCVLGPRLRRLQVHHRDMIHIVQRPHAGAVQLLPYPRSKFLEEMRRSATNNGYMPRLGHLCQHFSPFVTGESYYVNFTQCRYFSSESFSSADSWRIGKNGGPDDVAPGGGLQRQSDFFGEAITFVKDFDRNHIQGVKSQQNQSTGQMNKTIGSSPSRADSNISDAISSFDGMSLCILSKGSANLHTGNDADGPDAKAYHSSALAWSEVLQYAWEWNISTQYSVDKEVPSITTSPMLVVAAVAPVVAQGGCHYLRRIDKLLSTTRDSNNETPPSMWTMANYAVSFRDATLLSNTIESSNPDANSDTSVHHLLTPRERWHLHALHQLLHNNHRLAMGAYLRLLELFPGDLLGLSLALDVAYALGDSNAALRAATHVSTYWIERDGGALRLRRSHPAQNLAISLISVGLSSSSSSRASTAERLAELAIARDSNGAGGVSVWALSHCLASEGRSSEMVSKLAGFDGTQFYESSGFLHFSSRMKGYGAIALLDRSGAGADRSALRLYDGGFGNILEYSGNTVRNMERGGEGNCLRELRVPTNIKEDTAGALGSMLTGWFRGGNKSNNAIQNEVDIEGTKSLKNPGPRIQSVEDVLCWLPPSPILLTHATALLFRLTLCGAISESDYRWADVRVAWTSALKTDDASSMTQNPVEFMPMSIVASSLLTDPDELEWNELSQPLHNVILGLHKMGQLMKLGRFKPMQVSTQQQATSLVEDWREVLTLLASARDSCQRWETPTGMSSSIYYPPTANAAANSSITIRTIGWDFDLRQFLEYALFHAATKVGDYESLCLARAVISEGTTLRPNCPELWLRYGVILDMLGDEVGAENARGISISLGSGEGSASF